MLAIVVEGGIVQDIVTDEPELLNEPVVLIDYDTEGAYESELIRVPSDDARICDAYANVEHIARAGIDLLTVAKQLGLKERCTQATHVCRELVKAYNAGEARGGSVSWEELDDIHASAVGLVHADECDANYINNEEICNK
jgi:hypothetical protein